MKTTGIIRRIDELGRIVIPKEIRKNLRINDGESVEISVVGETIMLKKYSQIANVSRYADLLCEVIHSYLKKQIVITDNDRIIAASPRIRKDLINQQISLYLKNLVIRKEKVYEKHNIELKLTDSFSKIVSYAIFPILNNGDISGLIIVYSSDGVLNEDVNLCEFVSKILSKYIEQ